MRNNQNKLKSYQPPDPAKKKVCQFCGDNKYDGKYSKHLNSKHREIMANRTFLKNISKHLSAEQLEQTKQFIIKLKKS